ncbi:hypothetical protein ACNFR7_04760 [Streptomyces sp. RM1]
MPGFKPVRVTRIVPETPTISSLYLTTTDGTSLPEARPGQYLSIRLVTDHAAPRTPRARDRPGLLQQADHRGRPRSVIEALPGRGHAL